VDESKVKGFLLVGVFVASGAVSSLRSALRALRRPGQRSIHFVSERNAIRDAVVRTLIDMDVSALVVSATQTRGSRSTEDQAATRCCALM
jgi:hypothetical protein